MNARISISHLSLHPVLLSVLLLSLALSACKDKETGDTSAVDDTSSDTEDTDTGDSVPDERVSSFENGNYRVNSLTIVEDSETGFDLDGDGTIDNKFPSVLMLVDLAMDGDYSTEGFNATIAEALKTENLILLIEASQDPESFMLSYDLLLGMVDPKTKEIVVDQEQSYNGDVAYGHMQGYFDAETTYSTGPDDIQVPISFFVGEPALMVPIDLAVTTGVIDATSNTSMIGGAIPVNALVEQVVEPMIPEEGYEGQTKKEILKSISDLASNPNVSDLELSDGSRAFSATLTVQAQAW